MSIASLVPRRLCSGLSLLCLLGWFLLPFAYCNASDLSPEITDHWSRRAEDVTSRKTEHVKTVIQLLSPRIKEAGSSKARFLLIEAYYFYGEFISKKPEEKRQYFDLAREVSQVALLFLANKIGRQGSVFDLPVAEQQALFAKDPEAAETYFWGAITWGLFGMSHSMLASAKEDVAGKIKRYSEVLIALDPSFLDGAGYRLLGRLHALTPRVPFFSMWIDRAEAVRLLKSALAVSNSDPRNAFFLGEALLESKPDQRAYALTLLNEVGSRRPRKEYVIEDSQTITQAQQRLALEQDD